jgi:LmbE family N-acetylglucosaminyl deacetylase
VNESPRSPRRIAVIAAHPDDEVIGCGGTIARHVATGDVVSVLILAEGITSRHDARAEAPAVAVAGLAASARAAHAILGSAEVQLLDFPDNRMDQVALLDVIKPVERFLERVRPHVVYTHWPHDLNVDHRVVSEAVQTACRPLPERALDQLFYFEVASSTAWRLAGAATEFSPNHFVDVTAWLDLKLQALAAYGTEMRPWPHARSIEAIEHLARWRGATVGCQAAEAFTVARSLVR